jgi:hypothetical protein
MPDPNGDLDVDAIPPDQIVRVEDRAIRLDPELAFVTISTRFDRVDIFPHPPCIQDVRQVGIGDCFFLAALHSVLHLDPNLIYRMMRDRRGGWVVVRLYRQDNTPIYFEIEKNKAMEKTGLLNLGRRDLQGHGAVWVDLLEKAYALFRLRVENHQITPKRWVFNNATQRREQVSDPPRQARTYVEALTGGFSHDALQTLLGGQKRRYLLSSEHSASTAMVNLYSLVCCRSAADPTDTERGAFQTLFGPYAQGAMQAFARQFSVLKVQDFMAIQQPAKVIRQERLLALFEQHYTDLGRVVGGRLTEYVCRHFPGKRGTGLYTTEQLTLFRKVQEALQAGAFLAVGSGTNLGRGRGVVNRTQEHQIKGLAGPHAYQVVGVAQIQDAPVRFLRLRNPWLTYVRSYNWKQAMVNGHQVQVLSATQADQLPQLDAFQLENPLQAGPGEFLLELSDLTKRFAKLYMASGHGQNLPDPGELQALVA